MQTSQTASLAVPTPENQNPEIQALDEFVCWLLSPSTPRHTLELLAGHVALNLYRNVTVLGPADEKYFAGIVAQVIAALKQAQANEQAAQERKTRASELMRQQKGTGRSDSSRSRSTNPSA